jgi:hypothetical protein
MSNLSVEEILSKFDTALNSNTLLLHFGINNVPEFDLQRFLINQLRTGCFHYEIVINDIERGHNNYSAMIFNKDYTSGQPVFVPRPGNVWNGKEEIDYIRMSTQNVKLLLIDLLSGHPNEFTRSALGSPLKQGKAEEIVEELLNYIKGQEKDLEIYRIKPDFLRTVDEYYESDLTLPGFFEGNGRDLVLAFKKNEEIKFLLTNGYS